MKDLFGKAILDFQTNNNPANIVTETSISEADEMNVSYLFRDYNEMPQLERTALNLAYGKILDIGCGAGSHSLYLQNVKKLEVKAIDISANAITTCKLRGIKNTENINMLDLQEEKFDTIILLMNGTGIFEKLSGISKYLSKLKSLLNLNGQILIDSSDLIYMYDDAEDGGKWIPDNGYYGEITFTITYNNEVEDTFPWLYLDYNTLQNACHANGLQCELIEEGENYDYLARLNI